jgi:hypothetical protein
MLRVFAVLVLSLAVSGCSRGLLSSGPSSAPAAEQQVAVNNELALPPDLSLRAPGTYQPETASADTIETTAPAAPAANRVTLAPGARNPRDPMQTSLDKYNISRLRPDGTVKPRGQLLDEIRLAVIAEKRKTNPNYGTVFNSGELFNDN